MNSNQYSYAYEEARGKHNLPPIAAISSAVNYRSTSVRSDRPPENAAVSNYNIQSQQDMYNSNASTASSIPPTHGQYQNNAYPSAAPTGVSNSYQFNSSNYPVHPPTPYPEQTTSNFQSFNQRVSTNQQSFLVPQPLKASAATYSDSRFTMFQEPNTQKHLDDYVNKSSQNFNNYTPLPNFKDLTSSYPQHQQNQQFFSQNQTNKRAGGSVQKPMLDNSKTTTPYAGKIPNQSDTNAMRAEWIMKNQYSTKNQCNIKSKDLVDKDQHNKKLPSMQNFRMASNPLHASNVPLESKSSYQIPQNYNYGSPQADMKSFQQTFNMTSSSNFPNAQSNDPTTSSLRDRDGFKVPQHVQPNMSEPNLKAINYNPNSSNVNHQYLNESNDKINSSNINFQSPQSIKNEKREAISSYHSQGQKVSDNNLRNYDQYGYNVEGSLSALNQDSLPSLKQSYSLENIADRSPEVHPQGSLQKNRLSSFSSENIIRRPLEFPPETRYSLPSMYQAFESKSSEIRYQQSFPNPDQFSSKVYDINKINQYPQIEANSTDRQMLPQTSGSLNKQRPFENKTKHRSDIPFNSLDYTSNVDNMQKQSQQYQHNQYTGNKFEPISSNTSTLYSDMNHSHKVIHNAPMYEPLSNQSLNLNNIKPPYLQSQQRNDELLGTSNTSTSYHMQQQHVEQKAKTFDGERTEKSPLTVSKNLGHNTSHITGIAMSKDLINSSLRGLSSQQCDLSNSTSQQYKVPASPKCSPTACMGSISPSYKGCIPHSPQSGITQSPFSSTQSSPVHHPTFTNPLPQPQNSNQSPHHSSYPISPQHNSVRLSPHSNVPSSPVQSSLPPSPYHSSMPPSPYHNSISASPHHTSVPSSPQHVSVPASPVYAVIQFPQSGDAVSQNPASVQKPQLQQFPITSSQNSDVISSHNPASPSTSLIQMPIISTNKNNDFKTVNQSVIPVSNSLNSHQTTAIFSTTEPTKTFPSIISLSSQLDLDNCMNSPSIDNDFQTLLSLRRPDSVSPNVFSNPYQSSDEKTSNLLQNEPERLKTPEPCLKEDVELEKNNKSIASCDTLCERNSEKIIETMSCVNFEKFNDTLSFETKESTEVNSQIGNSPIRPENKDENNEQNPTCDISNVKDSLDDEKCDDTEDSKCLTETQLPNQNKSLKMDLDRFDLIESVDKDSIEFNPPNNTLESLKSIAVSEFSLSLDPELSKSFPVENIFGKITSNTQNMSCDENGKTELPLNKEEKVFSNERHECKSENKEATFESLEKQKYEFLPIELPESTSQAVKNVDVKTSGNTLETLSFDNMAEENDKKEIPMETISTIEIKDIPSLYILPSTFTSDHIDEKELTISGGTIESSNINRKENLDDNSEKYEGPVELISHDNKLSNESDSSGKEKLWSSEVGEDSNDKETNLQTFFQPTFEKHTTFNNHVEKQSEIIQKGSKDINFKNSEEEAHDANVTKDMTCDKETGEELEHEENFEKEFLSLNKSEDKESCRKNSNEELSFSNSEIDEFCLVIDMKEDVDIVAHDGMKESFDGTAMKQPEPSPVQEELVEMNVSKTEHLPKTGGSDIKSKLDYSEILSEDHNDVGLSSVVENRKTGTESLESTNESEMNNSLNDSEIQLGDQNAENTDVGIPSVIENCKTGLESVQSNNESEMSQLNDSEFQSDEYNKENTGVEIPSVIENSKTGLESVQRNNDSEIQSDVQNNENTEVGIITNVVENSKTGFEFVQRNNDSEIKNPFYESEIQSDEHSKDNTGVEIPSVVENFKTGTESVQSTIESKIKNPLCESEIQSDEHSKDNSGVEIPSVVEISKTGTESVQSTNESEMKNSFYESEIQSAEHIQDNTNVGISSVVENPKTGTEYLESTNESERKNSFYDSETQSDEHCKRDNGFGIPSVVENPKTGTDCQLIVFENQLDETSKENTGAVISSVVESSESRVVDLKVENVNLSVIAENGSTARDKISSSSRPLDFLTKDKISTTLLDQTKSEQIVELQTKHVFSTSATYNTNMIEEVLHCDNTPFIQKKLEDLDSERSRVKETITDFSISDKNVTHAISNTKTSTVREEKSLSINVQFNKQKSNVTEESKVENTAIDFSKSDYLNKPLSVDTNLEKDKIKNTSSSSAVSRTSSPHYYSPKDRILSYENYLNMEAKNNELKQSIKSVPSEVQGKTPDTLNLENLANKYVESPKVFSLSKTIEISQTLNENKPPFKYENYLKQRQLLHVSNMDRNTVSQLDLQRKQVKEGNKIIPAPSQPPPAHQKKDSTLKYSSPVTSLPQGELNFLKKGSHLSQVQPAEKYKDIQFQKKYTHPADKYSEYERLILKQTTDLRNQSLGLQNQNMTSTKSSQYIPNVPNKDVKPVKKQTRVTDKGIESSFHRPNVQDSQKEYLQWIQKHQIQFERSLAESQSQKLLMEKKHSEEQQKLIKHSQQLIQEEEQLKERKRQHFNDYKVALQAQQDQHRYTLEHMHQRQQPQNQPIYPESSFGVRQISSSPYPLKSDHKTHMKETLDKNSKSSAPPVVPYGLPYGEKSSSSIRHYQLQHDFGRQIQAKVFENQHHTNRQPTQKSIEQQPKKRSRLQLEVPHSNLQYQQHQQHYPQYQNQQHLQQQHQSQQLQQQQIQHLQQQSQHLQQHSQQLQLQHHQSSQQHQNQDNPRFYLQKQTPLETRGENKQQSRTNFENQKSQPVKKRQYNPSLQPPLRTTRNESSPGTSTGRNTIASPLDLSVKTVRQSADSTAKDEEAGHRAINTSVPKIDISPNFNNQQLMSSMFSAQGSTSLTSVPPKKQRKHLPQSLRNISIEEGLKKESQFPRPMQSHMSSRSMYPEPNNMPFMSSGSGMNTMNQYPDYMKIMTQNKPDQHTVKRTTGDINLMSPIPSKYPKVENWRQTIDFQIEQKLANAQQQFQKNQQKPVSDKPVSSPVEKFDKVKPNDSQLKSAQVFSGTINAPVRFLPSQFALAPNQLYPHHPTAPDQPGQTMTSQNQFLPRNRLPGDTIIQSHITSHPLDPAVRQPHHSQTIVSNQQMHLSNQPGQPYHPENHKQVMKNTRPYLHPGMHVADVDKTLCKTIVEPPKHAQIHNFPPFSASPYTQQNLPPFNAITFDKANFINKSQSEPEKKYEESKDGPKLNSYGHMFHGMPTVDNMKSAELDNGAARIRTKAELKQSDPGANVKAQTDGFPNDNVPAKATSPTRADLPPKLSKEKQPTCPPRKRLYSKAEDERGMGVRSSSETSIFDFRESDSEEPSGRRMSGQSLHEMRKDRKSKASTPSRASTPSIATTPQLVIEHVNVYEDDAEREDESMWDSVCSKFVNFLETKPKNLLYKRSRQKQPVNKKKREVGYAYIPIYTEEVSDESSAITPEKSKTAVTPVSAKSILPEKPKNDAIPSTSGMKVECENSSDTEEELFPKISLKIRKPPFVLDSSSDEEIITREKPKLRSRAKRDVNIMKSSESDPLSTSTESEEEPIVVTKQLRNRCVGKEKPTPKMSLRSRDPLVKLNRLEDEKQTKQLYELKFDDKKSVPKKVEDLKKKKSQVEKKDESSAEKKSDIVLTNRTRGGEAKSEANKLREKNESLKSSTFKPIKLEDANEKVENKTQEKKMETDKVKGPKPGTSNKKKRKHTDTNVDLKSETDTTPKKKPGWEDELYAFKRSLRMPASLIKITRPPGWPKPRASVSLPDLDFNPDSPSTCDSFEMNEDKSSKSTQDSEKEDQKISFLNSLAQRYGTNKKRKGKKTVQKCRLIPQVGHAAPVPLPTPNLDYELKRLREAITKDNDLPRTRTEMRKDHIRKVFGDDRPASAPPAGFPSEPVDPELHPEPQPSTSGITEKEILKIKKKKHDLKFKKKFIQSRTGLRSATKLRSKKVLLQRIQNKRRSSSQGIISNANKALNLGKDCQQNKIDLGLVEPIAGPSGIQLKKHSKLKTSRRKFRSSGFDYIRKKKKKKHAKRDLEEESERKERVFKGFGDTIEDVGLEIKSWVINKHHGETPLHRAARMGYIDAVAYCLERLDFGPAPRDYAGYTPLHEACSHGWLNIAKLLLSYGAGASDSAGGGIRPLHDAAEKGCVEVVRLLLSYGADPLLASYAGSTPLSMVSDESTRKLLEYHLSDVKGEDAPVWKFAGPASIFDKKNTGYETLNALENKRLEVDLELDEVPIEYGDTILPNIYVIRNEPQNEQWVLFNEISPHLKSPRTKDSLAKLLGQPNTAVFREMKLQEFNEMVRCTTLCGQTSVKINPKSHKVTLVKYNDALRNILKIQKIIIPTHC